MASVVMIGCGGGGGGGSGSGSGSGSALEDDLIGVWQRYEDDDVTLEVEYTFAEDGSFIFNELDGDDLDEQLTGSFSVDGEVLFADGMNLEQDRVTIEATVYTFADKMVFGALFAVGDHDGVYGTWEGLFRATEFDGEAVYDEIGSEARYEIRADDSATITRFTVDGEVDTITEATHEINAEGRHRVYYQASENVTIGFVFDLLDDAVLGSVDLERAP